MADVSALGGRTIQMVHDMSVDEQLYLFERARRFKGARNGNAARLTEGTAPPLIEVTDADEPEKVGLPDSTVYLIFMEGSTRTRESFRNAATYHGVKVNEFSAQTSSFQKNETITDTMKMLAVYSTQRSVFVVRSALEGVCSWLQTSLPPHAEKFGLPCPAFLNAGDGRNAHPTGELVDMFSILEHRSFDRSSVHVALVGDLCHGRLAHSKVDGLELFQKVRVDLIAPGDFEYPVEYQNKMWERGFQVRQFVSVEAYLAEAVGSIADLWYFYQPQFTRCGDLPESVLNELRTSVTFRAEWLPKLPRGAKFLQTLPRDKEHPLVPLAFDPLPLNGWEACASNAYFLDVVLLSMLFGKIGRGLPARDVAAVDHREGAISDAAIPGAQGAPLPDFIESCDLAQKSEHRRRPDRARTGGTLPIPDGVVVDHVGVSSDSANCWAKLRMIRTIMAWSQHVGSEGVYASSKKGTQGQLMKGIMTLPNFQFDSLTVSQLKVIASIAPGCTVNTVSGSEVKHKYRLHMPDRIYNLPNIHCKNELCVSNPKNKQRDVVAYFERVPFYETSALPGCKAAEFLFVCKYCKWPHQYENIWADSQAE